MAEEELPKKRKRIEDNGKTLQQYNINLLGYINKLEFLILETNRKAARSRMKFQKNIVRLAENLDKAGVSVPQVPKFVYDSPDPEPNFEEIWQEQIKRQAQETEEIGRKKAKLKESQ